MIPVPIPDACVPPGCKRMVIGPPDGDPTGDVRAVEAVVGVHPDQGYTFAMLIELEEGDLERLTASPAFWLTMWTNQIPPFALHIADRQDLDALEQEG